MRLIDFELFLQIFFCHFFTLILIDLLNKDLVLPCNFSFFFCKIFVRMLPMFVQTDSSISGSIFTTLSLHDSSNMSDQWFYLVVFWIELLFNFLDLTFLTTFFLQKLSMFLLINFEITTPIFNKIKFFLMIFIVILNSSFVFSIDDHWSTINIIFLHLVIFFIGLRPQSNNSLNIFYQIPKFCWIFSSYHFAINAKYYQTFFYKIITSIWLLSR